MPSIFSCFLPSLATMHSRGNPDLDKRIEDVPSYSPRDGSIENFVRENGEKVLAGVSRSVEEIRKGLQNYPGKTARWLDETLTQLEGSFPHRHDGQYSKTELEVRYAYFPNALSQFLSRLQGGLLQPDFKEAADKFELQLEICRQPSRRDQIVSLLKSNQALGAKLFATFPEDLIISSLHQALDDADAKTIGRIVKAQLMYRHVTEEDMETTSASASPETKRVIKLAIYEVQLLNALEALGSHSHGKARCQDRLLAAEEASAHFPRAIERNRWQADARSAKKELEYVAGILKQRTREVDYLLEEGVSANAATLDGKTALMFAAQANAAQVMRKLLARGADVNAKAVDGTTVLMCAAQHASADVVEMLLERGADANVVTKDGKTAATFAASGESRGYKALEQIKLAAKKAPDAAKQTTTST